ncbi:MAG: TM1812 family CRISPR-associated protein [Armatimonadota bacterium]|nr:TM1812 family CRISPR-associated protein [Armatimonadota bacterium]
MMLLTILGREAQETEYVLGDRRYRAALAPLAIVRLRGGFSHVVAFCTREATDKTLPVLREELPQGIRLEPRSISLPTSGAEIGPFLEGVAKAIEGTEGSVVLDVTHGPRHLPLLAFIVAVYLSALGRGGVESVYYAYLPRDGPSLIIDLKPLLELATLAFAAGELRRTGSTAALVERLKRDASKEAQSLGSRLRGMWPGGNTLGS